MKVTVIPTIIVALDTVTLTRELGKKGPSADHPHIIILKLGIIKIGQNSEKSLRDLKKLGVTQPLMRNHQVMLVLKTIAGLCTLLSRLTTKRKEG